MPKPTPVRYRTTKWSTDHASLRQRGSLTVWFDPDMVWHADKSGKRGLPETFTEAATQARLTLKVLFGLPLRRTVGLVERLIQIARLEWTVPVFPTLCRRQARAMSARSSSLRAVSATAHSSGKRSPGSFPDPPHFRNCWYRSRPANRSGPSPPTAPMTHEVAVVRSFNEARNGSYPSAVTAVPGTSTDPPPSREPRICPQPDTWAGRSERNGHDSMSEVRSGPG